MSIAATEPIDAVTSGSLGYFTDLKDAYHIERFRAPSSHFSSLEEVHYKVAVSRAVGATRAAHVGKDGFDHALERIAAIEQAFGLDDLGKLTAPAPPKPA